MIQPDFSQFPTDSGVYLMKDRTDHIIYIGKAKRLRQRIRHYFLPSVKDPKTQLLRTRIAHIEFIATATEADALVLERQLIQKHQPEFNIILKDDKNFPVVRISKREPFPKLEVVRSMGERGYTYFGPFPSMGSIRQFMKLIHALFPVRDCHQRIDAVSQQPKCIKLDMGTCLGPCIHKDPDAYRAMIQSLSTFLNGNRAHMIAQLQQSMQTAADAKHYEKAAIIRDQLRQIEQLDASNTVHITDKKAYHVWGFSNSDSLQYAIVQHIIDGKLIAQKGFYKTPPLAWDQFVQHTLLHYYTESPTETLLISEPIYQLLTELNLFNCQLACPKRGAKKVIVDTANRNAYLSMLALDFKSVKRDADSQSIVDTLRTRLSLRQPPNLIFGFDSSHFQGTAYVGSSVCFWHGQPDKSRYRRFQIKTTHGKSNDPQSIYELVTRRLQLCLKHHETLPDLCLIDGGKGQLSAAKMALYDSGLHHRIDTVALAKREEMVYSDHYPNGIQLGANDPGRFLLQQVRDESHRFARAYQRLKRKDTWFND